MADDRKRQVGQDVDPRTLDPESLWCQLNSAMSRLMQRTDEVVALDADYQRQGRVFAREIEQRDAKIAQLEARLSEFESVPDPEGVSEPEIANQD